jgi:hypothetical protein
MVPQMPAAMLRVVFEIIVMMKFANLQCSRQFCTLPVVVNSFRAAALKKTKDNV